MDDILDYDLKLEMYKIRRRDDVERLYDDTKARELYSFDELFERKVCSKEYFKKDKYIIRYILFKYINNKENKIGFDADKTLLSKDYYRTFNEENKRYKYQDTYFSVQTIWREIVKILDNTKGNDFKWQLDNYEKIRELLITTNLHDTFSEYMYRYHTIPNIAPCPNPPFNTRKGSFKIILDDNGNKVGSCSRYLDRLDLFLKGIKDGKENDTMNKEKQEEILNWFKENTSKFYLEEYLDNNLPETIVFPENIEDKERLKNIREYIQMELDIISRRKDKLKESK